MRSALIGAAACAASMGLAAAICIFTQSSSLASSQKQADTLAYGSRAGMQVTVTAREGIDTRHAVIHVAHMRSDAETYCREYENTSAKACVDQEMKTGFPAQIEADCVSGDFTNLNSQRRHFDGPNSAGSTAYVITDKETGEALDGSSASGYDVDIEQFRALCPSRVSASQTTGSEQGNADPAATIASVVALVDTGKMPSWPDEQFYEVAKPYATHELLAAIHDGGEVAGKTGQDIWDADIFTGGMGIVHAKLFGANVASRDESKATVIAEIGTTDTDTPPKVGGKYRYEMRWEDSAWKIDDMKPMEDWAKDMKSLKETFLSAEQMAGIEPGAGDAVGTVSKNNPLRIAAQKILVPSDQEKSFVSARIRALAAELNELPFQADDLSESLANILIASSMVRSTEDKHNTVLYNIFGDVFVILTPSDSLLISGETLHDLVSDGRVKEDPNMTERLFHQRYQLQDAVIKMIQEKKGKIVQRIRGMQADHSEARRVVDGIAVIVQTMDQARNSKCFESVKNNMLSVEKANGHMKLVAMWKLADGDYYVMQDNEIGRIFFILGTSPTSNCRVIRQSTILSY